MRDLVPFLQFKRNENTQGGVVTLLHGCFSGF